MSYQLRLRSGHETAKGPRSTFPSFLKPTARLKDRTRESSMQSGSRVRLVFPELELRAWQKSEINSSVVMTISEIWVRRMAPLADVIRATSLKPLSMPL